MVMLVSEVKALTKSPSTAMCSLASMPLLAQVASTTAPPLAVRLAVMVAHLGPSSVGSIGLPSRHLVSVCGGVGSLGGEPWHKPALGAGIVGQGVQGPGPAATGG